MVNVIAMLTHNDQTVSNAKIIYQQNREAITTNWGFKDNNISNESAKELASLILADGKELFFESLVTTADKALEIAKVAVECGANYIIGMEYFDNVHIYLKSAGVKYFPTCGKRAGFPLRMLHGKIEEIVKDANRILNKGVDGICLSVFRYADGEPLELAKSFMDNVDSPLIITGGINSDDRLDFIYELQPWGFTVGSALFENDEFPGHKIADKLDYITNSLSKRT